MAGYTCPSCGKNSKLPDFCCGKNMEQEENCNTQTNTSQDCCNSPMRKQ